MKTNVLTEMNLENQTHYSAFNFKPLNNTFYATDALNSELTHSPNAPSTKPETVVGKTREYKFINMVELKQSPNYGKRVYPDSEYEGEILNNKRQGKGIMKYANGRFYEGSWEGDFRHGKGFERFHNGNTYEGEYSHGKANGKGIYTWRNGETYDGEWKDGLKHGDGAWKGISGDSYIGEWRHSKAEGYGVHIWKFGDRYEGEWKACLKHGNGTDIFANGDTYSGQYRMGKPCGYGQYIWKNGGIYTGEFDDGMKHGFGKWRKDRTRQSNTYEGQYFKDKKQGFGVFRWASGNVYRGQYRADEREGLGEMRWTDGSRYIGQWAHGIQHGRGRMIFPDGTEKEGLFENNVYKGTLFEAPDFPELGEPNFDIMSLVPTNCHFSEEAMASPPINRELPSHHPEPIPQPYSSYKPARQEPIQRHYRTASHQSTLSPASQTALFSVPIRRVAYNPTQARGRIRPQHRRQETRHSYIQNNGKSFACSTRGFMKNVRAREIFAHRKQNNTTVYSSPSKRSSKTGQHRAWIPSGKVHYREPSRLPIQIRY